MCSAYPTATPLTDVWSVFLISDFIHATHTLCYEFDVSIDMSFSAILAGVFNRFAVIVILYFVQC